MKKKKKIITLLAIIAASSFAFADKSTMKAGAETPCGQPIQMKCTAYCSCKQCCGHSHGITKSGRPVVEGLTIASNVYYGKTLILYDEDMNYIGIYEVTDTGTDHLDIYLDSHQKALEFGVHYYYIQVVDAVG